MIRRALFVLAGLVALALAAAAAFLLHLVDLRPDSVSVGDDPAAELVGRMLLREMVAAHGGADALQRHHTFDAELRDTWVGVGRWFNPWPDDDQRVHLTTRVGRLDASTVFHNGPRTGERWSVRDRVVRSHTASADRVVDDADLRFMLPTVQYFVEMPVRLPEAAIVRSVGRQRVGDHEYDVVYATWGSVEANRAFDQYLVYLDPESHQLAKVWYTVRELGGFVQGIAHFEALVDVDGYLLPARVTVTPGLGDDVATDGLHTMVFTDAAFDVGP